VLEAGLPREERTVDGAHRRPDRRIWGLAGPAPHPVDPDAQLDLVGGVDGARLHQAVDLLPLRDQLRWILAAVGCGRNEYRALDRIGVLERELDRHASAQRHAHHRGPLASGRLHHRQGIVVQRVGTSRVGRLAEPSLVVADRGEALAQGVPMRVPGAAITDPLVYQQERRPVAPDLEHEAVRPPDPRCAHAYSLTTIAAVMNWASGPVG
jgi:hypothetical protein